jgi:cation transport ATPase
LFDPPRHDSAETIQRALNLGVCVKMITGNNENPMIGTKTEVLVTCYFLCIKENVLFLEFVY